MEKLRILRQQRNRIEAQIDAIEQGLDNSTCVQFITDCRNLLDGIGSIFVPGVYDTPDRIYSVLNGVRHISIVDDEIHVMVLSPSGFLLPNVIRIGDYTYNVRFDQYDKRKWETDY